MKVRRASITILGRLAVMALLPLLAVTLSGCEPRTPSATLLDAITRKDYQAQEVATLLEDQPALVNQTNASGQSALHLACLQGRQDAVAQLLEHGASLQSVDHKGRTPLHAACHAGQAEIAGLLMAAGANPRAADHEGRTPLHEVACWNPAEVELIRLLIQQGADPGARTKADHTPLDLARRQQQQHRERLADTNRPFDREMIQHFQVAAEILEQAADGPATRP